MTPHNLRYLLECLRLPGPACDLISRFAVEHPTAKLIKELEFEDSPITLDPQCYSTFVYGHSLPLARKVFNHDAEGGYTVLLDYSYPSYRALTFDKETGEPPSVGSPMVMNGHKWHVRARVSHGMQEYESTPGPNQWAYDKYTTRRGRQARRRSRLRRVRERGIVNPIL